MRLRLTDTHTGIEFDSCESTFPEDVKKAIFDFWMQKYPPHQTKKIASGIHYGFLSLHLLQDGTWWDLHTPNGCWPAVGISSIPPWEWVEQTAKKVEKWQKFKKSLLMEIKTELNPNKNLF